MTATITAVSSNPEHGFSKHPQPHIVLLAGQGVEGDAHCGATTQHLYLQRKDLTHLNLCQVHLLSEELLAEYTAAAGPTNPALTAGDLGENILTRGLDLLALPLNTRLHLGEAAVITITGLRTPCSQIDAFRPGLQQHLWGPREPGRKRSRRAGIMATVTTGGTVRPGDAIRVELPDPPFLPLPPV